MDVLRIRNRAVLVDLRVRLRGVRFWIIGDVHGCFDELQQLLEKGGYRTGEVLLFTGDLVNRGPKVAETLRFVRQTPNAFVVKGNHDDRFARWLAGRTLEISSGLDCSIASTAEWTPEQRESCREWIESWPHIFRIPDLAEKPCYVVHAGVDGAQPMEEQSQEDCLYARYVGGKDHLDSTSGRFWYHTLTGDRLILFGHIPHENPHPAPDALALDGGAVKGGVLRAFLRSPERPDGELLEVPGKPYYAGKAL
jgi:protein phosphatase